MKIYKKHLLLVILMIPFCQLFSQMVILSGPEKGTNYRFAADILKVMEENEKINLTNRSTGGSAFNFKELSDSLSGFKIALLQSDYLNLMKAQDRLNNTNKTGTLRVIFELAPSQIQFITKKTSGLKTLKDLENKKVAFGNDELGAASTGRIIRERSKINWISIFFPFDQMLKELISGTVDAFMVVGAAPVSLLDIDPQVMIGGGTMLTLEDFNGWAQYYQDDTVYRTDYKWLDNDVPTFSVKTLLVVNDANTTPAEKKTIAAIEAGIVKNLALLKKQGHPGWKKVIPPAGSSKVVKAPQKTTEVKTSKDDMKYRVQLFSSNIKQKEDQVTINGKIYKTYMYFFQGENRYTIGEFKSLSAAQEFQNDCRNSGYPQAFVAAFRNNERVIQ